jgi:hypothetical protein
MRRVVRKPKRFTKSRGAFDRESFGMKVQAAALGLAIIGLMASAAAATPDARLVLAQAMVPPTGASDSPLDMSEPGPMTERMNRRFPQPVRVGDLIGLRVLDDDDLTIGFVRQVVRTPENRIELVVSYGGWFGWGARDVAVPIEVVAILGRQLASIDMPRSEYATAPTWRRADATALPNDASIRVALGRR